MPSVSKKQHNFMAAVANNPAFAKKAGVPQSVGQDFTKADKGRKFSKGGDMATRKPFPKGLFKGKESMAEELKEAKAIKSGKITPMQYAKGEKSEPTKKMATGGRAERIENLRNFGRRQTAYPAGVTRRQGPSSGTSTRPASALPIASVGATGPKKYSEPTPEQIKQMIAMKEATKNVPQSGSSIKSVMPVQKPAGPITIDKPGVMPDRSGIDDSGMGGGFSGNIGEAAHKAMMAKQANSMQPGIGAKPTGPTPVAPSDGSLVDPMESRYSNSPMPQIPPNAATGMARGGGVEARGKTKGKAVKMARGGGVETKGKTKGTIVKMARGGGVESRGKTRGTMVKMMGGGKC